MALLEHDFVIQHKGGYQPVAHYLPQCPDETEQIAAIDPFQTNFQNSRLKDPDLVIIQEFEWPTHFNMAKQNHYYGDYSKTKMDSFGYA